MLCMCILVLFIVIFCCLFCWFANFFYSSPVVYCSELLSLSLFSCFRRLCHLTRDDMLLRSVVCLLLFSILRILWAEGSRGVIKSHLWKCHGTYRVGKVILFFCCFSPFIMLVTQRFQLQRVTVTESCCVVCVLSVDCKLMQTWWCS